MASDKYFQLHNSQRLHSLEGLLLASFKRRAIAFLIDLIISFLLFLAILIIIGIFMWYHTTGGDLSGYPFTLPIAKHWVKNL